MDAQDDIIPVSFWPCITGYEDFEPLLYEARRRAYTVKNVKSAWKKADLVPFNPQKVLGKLCRPDLKVERGVRNRGCFNNLLSGTRPGTERPSKAPCSLVAATDVGVANEAIYKAIADLRVLLLSRTCRGVDVAVQAYSEGLK